MATPQNIDKLDAALHDPLVVALSEAYDRLSATRETAAGRYVLDYINAGMDAIAHATAQTLSRLTKG
jgi:hypothetical protein